MKTYIYSLHFLLATLLFGLTACGTQSSSEEDSDICSDPEFADFEESPFVIDLPEGIKWNGTGDVTNLDLDLGIIYLAAPSEGPDDEAIGTLTLLFDEPRDRTTIDHLTPSCGSRISSATLSTTDVRRGTGEELNGRLYGIFGSPGQYSEPCEHHEGFQLDPNFIEFFYVSRSSAYGWFCVELEEISPGSGEPFIVEGSFAIRN